MLPPRLPARRIAVVEDDHHLRQDLLDFLRWRGHVAFGCESAEVFEALQERAPVDLVLLDIGLPGLSGLELLRRLRQPRVRSTRTAATTPLEAPSPAVVILSSFATDADQARGLIDGADAYVVKGASLEVIEATCISVLRRTTPGSAPPQTAPSGSQPGDDGVWTLDEARSAVVAPDGQRTELTHTETLFLRGVFLQPGTPVSREQLLQVLGKEATAASLRNLDNCATRIRRKVLARTGHDLPVRSCYGQGYALRAEARRIGPA